MGLFGGDSGPSGEEAASQYLDQIPDLAKGYYDPYIQHGQAAYGAMSPQLEAMTRDPTAFINALQSQYRPSAGFKLQRDEALRAAGNTAAAGGMRGSIQDIDRAGQISQRLQGADMQQWLNNVLGVQQQGIAGEQNIYGMGYDASKNLESDLANVLGQKGQYAFQQSREDKQSGSDMLSGILGAAGGIVGGIYGGPMGAMAGSSIGSSVGGMM